MQHAAPSHRTPQHTAPAADAGRDPAAAAACCHPVLRAAAACRLPCSVSSRAWPTTRCPSLLPHRVRLPGPCTDVHALRAPHCTTAGTQPCHGQAGVQHTCEASQSWAARAQMEQIPARCCRGGCPGGGQGLCGGCGCTRCARPAAGPGVWTGAGQARQPARQPVTGQTPWLLLSSRARTGALAGLGSRMRVQPLLVCSARQSHTGAGSSVRGRTGLVRLGSLWPAVRAGQAHAHTEQPHSCMPGG